MIDAVRFPIVLAVVLRATPVLAQSSGSDTATGLAGLMGMFGVFGFLLALFYSILLFCLPFMVWGCLKRLTDIRDETRGFRRDLASRLMSVASPSTGEKRDLGHLQRLMKENEARTFTFENPG